MKAIVIYYSWGGNTKSIAEKVARELNCGTARIDTVVPYEGDYNSIVDQGRGRSKARIRAGDKAARRRSFGLRHSNTRYARVVVHLRPGGQDIPDPQ